MSFERREDGSFVRLTFNPEDVTDGKPRVLKFRMIRTNQKGKELNKEEEIEIDRELTHITNIDGYEEKDPDKHLLLNMLGDLSSETLVLLGTSYCRA